jgi:AAA+ superfamily predicted ATPase
MNPDPPNQVLPEYLELSLKHLEAELARIDIFFHREVRRWQLAGQDPGDVFRGQYITDTDANALVKRPFGRSWGQTIELTDDDNQTYSEALERIDQYLEEIHTKSKELGYPLNLDRLVETFNLDSFERDTLLICLGPTLDLRYEKLCGYLQDDVTRKRPAINLVLDLLASSGASRLLKLAYFADDAPLFKHQILTRSADTSELPLLDQSLIVDNGIIAWLLGRYQPPVGLGHSARLIDTTSQKPDMLLSDEMCVNIKHIAAGHSHPVVLLYGVDLIQQEAAGLVLARQFHRPLLKVDLAGSSGRAQDEIARHHLRLSLRDALLTGSIPYLMTGDSHPLLTSETLASSVLEELNAFPGPVIISSLQRWQPAQAERQRPLFYLDFPTPGFQERALLWEHFLDDSAAIDPQDLNHIAGQFLLTVGKIRDSVATAHDTARQEDVPLSAQHLFHSARSHSSPALASLAKKLVIRYTWEDIILPDDVRDTLREIVATVRGRPQVLEEWGVGKKLASSNGITVLFGGPPGTGKTMAAEVIAGELKLDLYKIDLSTVVSKYIGETEKNLEKIFSEAESSNAILFFDEADALFGKRSEVRDSHDRYANIEISYLLQRMEAYDGVTILATNLRANLDEAFTRRLQFVVDFPFPDEEDQLRIWQTLYPEGVPSGEDIDFNYLSQRFKLAGGNIRNVIVNAAYLAAADGLQVTMGHLLHSIRRELQKMGRLIPESDLIITPDEKE